jgi:hypothetical protein
MKLLAAAVLLRWRYAPGLIDFPESSLASDLLTHNNLST